MILTLFQVHEQLIINICIDQWYRPSPHRLPSIAVYAKCIPNGSNQLILLITKLWSCIKRFNTIQKRNIHPGIPHLIRYFVSKLIQSPPPYYRWKEWTKEHFAGFVELFTKLTFLNHEITFTIENLVHSFLVTRLKEATHLLAVPLLNLLPITIIHGCKQNGVPLSCHVSAKII